MGLFLDISPFLEVIPIELPAGTYSGLWLPEIRQDLAASGDFH